MSNNEKILQEQNDKLIKELSAAENKIEDLEAKIKILKVQITQIQNVLNASETPLARF